MMDAIKKYLQDNKRAIFISKPIRNDGSVYCASLTEPYDYGVMAVIEVGKVSLRAEGPTPGAAIDALEAIVAGLTVTQ
jgi:hypothetical protein